MGDEVDELKDKLRTEQTKNKTLKKTVKKLEDELDEAQEALVKLKGKLEKERAAHAATKAELAELQDDARYRQSQPGADGASINELQRELTATKQELIREREETNRLHDRINTLERQSSGSRGLAGGGGYGMGGGMDYGGGNYGMGGGSDYGSLALTYGGDPSMSGVASMDFTKSINGGGMGGMGMGGVGGGMGGGMQWEQQKQELHQNINFLREQADKLSTEKRALQQQVDSLKKDNERLQDNHASEKDEWNRKLARLQADAEAASLKLSRAESRARDDMESGAPSIDEVAEARKYKKRAKNLEEENDELRRRVAEEKHAHEGEMREMTSRMKAEADKHAQIILEKDNAFSLATKRGNRLEQELNQTMEELSEVNTELKRMRATAADAESKAKRLDDALEEVERLRNQLTETESALRAEKKQHLDASVDTEAAMRRLNDELAMEKEGHEKAKNRRDFYEGKMNELKAQLAAMEDTVEEHKAAVVAAEEEMNRMKKKLKTTLEKAKEYKKNMEKSRAEFERMETDYGNLEREIQTLRRAETALQLEKTSLVEQLEKVTAEKASLRSDVGREADELRETLRRSRNEWEEREADLKKRIEMEKDELRSVLERQRDEHLLLLEGEKDAKGDLKNEMTLALQEAEDRHDAYIESLQDSHREERLALEEEWQEKLKESLIELQDVCNMQLDELREELTMERSKAMTNEHGFKLKADELTTTARILEETREKLTVESNARKEAEGKLEDTMEELEAMKTMKEDLEKALEKCNAIKRELEGNLTVEQDAREKTQAALDEQVAEKNMLKMRFDTQYDAIQKSNQNLEVYLGQVAEIFQSVRQNASNVLHAVELPKVTEVVPITATTARVTPGDVTPASMALEENRKRVARTNEVEKRKARRAPAKKADKKKKNDDIFAGLPSDGSGRVSEEDDEDDDEDEEEEEEVAPPPRKKQAAKKAAPAADPQLGTKKCTQCMQPFTFVRRKHECRKCNSKFCGDCCQKRAVPALSPSPVRVCDRCYEALA